MSGLKSLDPLLFSNVLDATEPSQSGGLLDQGDVVPVDDLEGGSEKETTAGMNELFATLNEASRGVSEGTHNEYMQ
jgi:hypothetical protein